MRSVVVVLIGMTTAAHADRPDPVAAALLVVDARALARDGQCAAALRLRPEIEARDVDAWRVATSEDPRLAACVVATPPHEDVAGGPSTIEPTAPPARGCSTTGYLEPSLLFAPVSGASELGIVHRIASGVLVRSCTSPYHARLGGTAYVSNHSSGIGFEAELSHRLGDDWHVGGHVAVETQEHANGVPVESIDLRVHFHDAAWFQLGMSTSGIGYGPPRVAAGFGFEGKPGAVIVGIEVTVITTLFGMLVYACSQGGCGG